MLVGGPGLKMNAKKHMDSIHLDEKYVAQLLLGNSEINIFDRENNSIHNTTQLK
jgi:hypothetical protein